jgi:hypothetical protein
VSKSLSKVEELEVGASSAEILGLPIVGDQEDIRLIAEDE